MNKKSSGGKVTQLASNTLRDSGSSEIQRKLAGSVLAQAGTTKQTGTQMEDIAARVLTSDKYNEVTKTLAGSVLSQSNKER